MKIKRKRPRGRNEYQIQESVAGWLDAHPLIKGRWTHYPSGGYRPSKTSGWMKRFGAKPGLPDVLIFAPCVDKDHVFYVGLALELKKAGNWSVSKPQKHWLTVLRHNGWLTAVTQGDQDPLALLKRLYPRNEPLHLPLRMSKTERVIQAQQLEKDWPELSRRRLLQLTRLTKKTYPPSPDATQTQTPHAEIIHPPPPKKETARARKNALKRWLLKKMWRSATDQQLSDWSGVEIEEVVLKRSWNTGSQS